MEDFSAISRQVIQIPDTRNVVSLELVQHQKVRLQLETYNTGETITAELLSPNCKDDLPCTKLDYSVLPSDLQTYLTVGVHPPEQNGFFIYVTWVLVFGLAFLLLTWMIRKWMKWNNNKDLEDEDVEEKENSESELKSSTETKEAKEIHKQQNESNKSAQRFPEERSIMIQIRGVLASRMSSPFAIFSGMVLVVCLLGMVVMFGASRHEIRNDLPVLKLRFPENKLIRHIRSYSEDPDIRDIDLAADERSSRLATRLQLLDLSPDCRSNLTGCRTHALCDTATLEGQMKCRCNRGFYLRDFQCVPCQTSCQDGFYMTEQCSTIKDVVCKPCTQCEGTSYEVAACTTTQDTICIDVTFPLKQFQSRPITEDELVHWNVTTSNNVFLERLQGIQKLEMPLYLYSNGQVIQYTWVRPNSGLGITVKVSQQYLVPEYVELDYTDVDDKKYIDEAQDYPSKIKDQLERVRERHCSFPIPDEYDLSLEFVRNAVTESLEVTCDTSKQCPDGIKDGEKYVLHKLNTSCSKIPFSGDLFNFSPNSISCLGNNDLLGKIFNMEVGNPVGITFPTTECENSKEACGRCLVSSACDRVSNVTDCCNVKCHQRAECKQYFSDRCPPAPVECTRGDISRFGILPRYRSILTQFACHLKHLPPPYLYQLSYEVTVPFSQKFSLGVRSKDIEYKNFADHQDGADQVDYIQMTHHTESKYDDEVILIGRINESDPNTVNEYTLHKLKTFESFDRLPGFNIEHRRRDKFRTTIQFEKPFLYSTSTWSRDSCQRNVSRIFPSQSINEKDEMLVNRIKKKRRNGTFVYEILPNEAKPHIRLSIPENVSVLSFYRETYNSVRINPWDLKGEMVWNTLTRYWNVTMSGSLTACPGIFTLEIYTENTDTLISSYDMLIQCPNTFSTSFEIERNSVELVDVFVVILNDSVSSYRMYLSSVQGPQFFKNVMIIDDKKAVDDLSPWTTIVVVLVICLCPAVFLTAIYIYCEKQKSKFIPANLNVPKPDLGPQITLLQNMDKGDTNKRMTWKTKCIMMTLVVLYVAYALIFTFLAVFGLFHLIQGPSLSRVTLATNTSSQVQYQMQRALDAINEYENIEINRLLNLTGQRVSACSNHLKKTVFESMPDGNKQLQSVLLKIFQNNGAVKKRIAEYISIKQASYENEIEIFLGEFNKTLDATLHRIQANFSSYLNLLVESDWLTFPKGLFMQQELLKGQVMTQVTENLVGFLRWLEIDKVQEVFEMREILMKRLQTMMPKVDFTFLLNDSVGTVQTSVDLDFNVLANTFRFVSYNPVYTPPWSYEDLDDYNFEKEDSSRKNNRFRMPDLKGILYPVFICAFLVLDSCLLIYRFSWMLKSLKVFKTGLEDKVPYDTMTRKIHFILTGYDVPKPEDSFDDPYDFVRNRKENMWGENTEQYFIYCQSPEKRKIEILRQLWQDKQQTNPKPEPKTEKKNCCKTCIFKFAKTTYRLFISPLFWRFALICGFLLIICLFAKATNDLVTLESAMFLLDTDAMLPILERQNDVTNNVIAHYESYLNNFLIGYKDSVDGEVQMINKILLNVAERQKLLLNTMISDMCSLIGQNSCEGRVDLVANSFTSCNFLPLHSKPLEGFQESVLLEYIQMELAPLVSSLRSLLFSSLYLLLVCAAVMILSQIAARVILVNLKNSNHLKVSTIFQLPSRCEFSDQQDMQKDMYASQSVIAESCESGVYDLTN